MMVGSGVMLSGCTKQVLEDVKDVSMATESDVEQPVQADAIMPPTPKVSPEPQSAQATQNLMGDLKAVGAYQGIGYAAITGYQEGYTHTVIAQLEAPTEGSVYEGWLVDQSTGDFFSTGVLELVADEYQLVYMSEGDFEEYTFVVITEETVVDETPETHVLEGVMK